MNKLTPRYEDLLPLTEFISEKYPSFYPISIVITLPKEKQILEKINEDYFYRLNPEGKKEDIRTDIEEVIVNIGGIKVKYVEE